MDPEEFAERIVAEYDACDEATAATIADNANQFEAEVETDRSVNEWLSFM